MHCSVHIANIIAVIIDSGFARIIMSHFEVVDPFSGRFNEFKGTVSLYDAESYLTHMDRY